MAKRRNRKTNKVRVIKNPVVESVVNIQEPVFVPKPDNFAKVINIMAIFLNKMEKHFYTLFTKMA